MNQEEGAMAVILAAGKGTRMKSELPKVLCEANGKALVEYVIEALARVGVTRSIVVVGYRADLVKQRLAAWPSIEFVEQTEQLGTGHAVAVCRDRLVRHRGPVIVVAGDSPMMQPESLRQLLDDFHRKQAAAVLGTLVHERPTGLGRIVRDEAGKFLGIVEEKDASNEQRLIREVNMSTYVFDTQRLLGALDQLKNNNRQNEYYLTDVPAILLGGGEVVRALPVLQPIEALSVNTLEDLRQVEQALLRSQSANA